MSKGKKKQKTKVISSNISSQTREKKQINLIDKKSKFDRKKKRRKKDKNNTRPRILK